MEEKKQIDFKKFTSPSSSKMYLLKIAFYIIVLGGLIYLMKSKFKSIKPKVTEPLPQPLRFKTLLSTLQIRFKIKKPPFQLKWRLFNFYGLLFKPSFL